LLYEFLLGKEKEEKHNTCLGSVATFIGYGFVIFDLGGWFYGFWGVGQWFLVWVLWVSGEWFFIWIF
jgi:hypothetical protein